MSERSEMPVVVIPTPATAPDMWVQKEPGHVPTGPNPNAMNGGPGGGVGEGWLDDFAPTERPQGGGGGGFYVRNGVYVPLQYVDAGNPLQGGYGYCDRTDNGRTFHPGVDLNAGGFCNADDGVEVVAPLDGTVIAVLPWNGTTSGEGNHLWFAVTDPRAIASAWMHLDHLRELGVREGQKVVAGQTLGRCGRTGNWPCAHLHTEFAARMPTNWYQWPLGWSLGAVQAAYYDPGWWYAASADKAGLMALNGGGTAPPDSGGTLPMETTEAERTAMKPYFEMYGVPCNMETAILKRAALAYKREETPGPAITAEYAWGDAGFVRQQFTCRTLEWHPQDGLVYYVEQNLEARA